MDPYAQTNIQLYEQLRCEGYSPAEIRKLSEAYGICPGLFACLYRPSGKTFIAHLVGTASILASLRVPIDIVIAGLLHAAYAHGDFGTGLYDLSLLKQRQLRRIVGVKAEEYIARYTRLLWWTESNIRAVYRRINDLDSVDRDVLLIRLTNELEELLDYGWLYWSSLAGRRSYRDRVGQMVIEMAETIGFPVLAKEFEKRLDRSARTEIPSEMRDEGAAVMATASTMIPSRAIGLKPRPYVRRSINRSLHLLRKVRAARAQKLLRKIKFVAHRLLRSKSPFGWPKAVQRLDSTDSFDHNERSIGEAWLEIERGGCALRHYAQTVLQLYGQMFSEGYSNEAVHRVRGTYALAADLFSGRFQPSNKTFIAHVIGTASILASIGASVDLICAGLLHNVYHNGEFGDRMPGISGRKRKELQKHVGLEVERYLTEFAALPWEREALLALCHQIEKIDAFARGALLIRAADELEHLLDSDVQYCGATYRSYYLNNAATYTQISECLGMCRLGQEIQKAFEQNNSGTAPMPNGLQPIRNVSYAITPPSYRQKVCRAMIHRASAFLGKCFSIPRRKSKLAYWYLAKAAGAARFKDR